jgi:hypothetical protein
VKKAAQLGLVAQLAVDRVAQHLIADQPEGDPAKSLYELMTTWLKQTKDGRSQLEAFLKGLTSQKQLTQTAKFVLKEMQRSDIFEQNLTGAAEKAGLVVSDAKGKSSREDGGTYTDGNSTSGKFSPIAGGDVQINKSINLGLGNAALVAVVIFLTGGSVGAIGAHYATGPNVPPSMTVSLDQIVGSWELRPSVRSTFNQAMSLTVSPDGKYSMMTDETVGPLGAHNECGGIVTADGDHYTLHSSSGGCYDQTLKLVGNGQALDVVSTNGESVALTRKS